MPIIDIVRNALHQIIEVLTTLSLIGLNIGPAELRDWVKYSGKSIKFNPTKDIADLNGKVILVTGGLYNTSFSLFQLLTITFLGNAGLGLETIRYLCSHNPSRIYLAARNPQKASRAIASIRRSIPSSCEIRHLSLDLTSFASVSNAASTFLSQEPRLDILINNAGVLALPYTTTREGHEVQFGTNHMGHALLTKLLLPVMLKTAEGGEDVRMVNVASIGHYLTPSGGIMFDHKELENQHTWRRYGNSKLANIVYTRQLAERYPQITTVSVHPGVIVTDIYASVAANPLARGALWLFGAIANIIPGCFGSVKGGALTQTWAATAVKGELENGAFYRPVGVGSGGSRWARDEGLGKKLWEWTEGEMERCGY